MRKINFRAWYIGEKRMLNLENYRLEFDGFDYGIFRIYKKNKKGIYEMYINDKHSILLQYTGLKDVNGKEIYEGDIITHPTLELTKGIECIVVEWDEKMCGWNIRTRRAKIIGNIYENKDLINKIKK